MMTKNLNSTRGASEVQVRDQVNLTARVAAPPLIPVKTDRITLASGCDVHIYGN